MGSWRVAADARTAAGAFTAPKMAAAASSAAPTVSVVLGCSLKDGKATLRFSDNGRPYDPTEKPDPDTTQSAEEREVGGLGIFMVKKLMDEVTYEYADGSNILTLVKSL